MINIVKNKSYRYWRCDTCSAEHAPGVQRQTWDNGRLVLVECLMHDPSYQPIIQQPNETTAQALARHFGVKESQSCDTL